MIAFKGYSHLVSQSQRRGREKTGETHERGGEDVLDARKLGGGRQRMH